MELETSALNAVLNPEMVADSRQLYWMLLLLCKRTVLRLVMMVPRNENAEACGNSLSDTSRGQSDNLETNRV
eukprot:12910212-Prorocentrum_lima.AAC.1